MFNKIKGGLFGVAVGDALGCAVEFMTPEEIEEKYGFVTEITGGGPFFFQKGEVTDDTDMTLCVARGILKNPLQPIEEIGKEFVEWMMTRPKDVGITTRYSIGNFTTLKDWDEASEYTHRILNGRSAGNGTIMRTLPVALAYQDINKIQKISYQQSKMTHWDDKAAEACVLYNRIAHRLLSGEELKEVITTEIEPTEYNFALSYEPAGNPDGYVCNTLEWTVYILKNTNTFEEAVVAAVNAGYDTDTTAAVVGGLAGIYYGYDGIPERYKKEILIAEELKEVSKKLTELREEGTN